MTHTALEERKAALEARFDELTKSKQDIDDELKRLQGEHRLVVELLNEAPAVERPRRIRKVVETNAED